MSRTLPSTESALVRCGLFSTELESLSVSDSLEFHDSTLSSIAVEGVVVRLGIDAYVHRWAAVGVTFKGTGWIVPVRVVLADASADFSIDLPVDLDGGEIRAGAGQHSNLVPLPFRSTESGSLRLDLANGAILTFDYSSISVEPAGEGRYVEALSDDFRPN